MNLGSPPQVRGKRCVFEFGGMCDRITPAGAGKTRCWAASRVSLRDHPRRCGENPTTKRAYRRTPGSPPQVRGKQTHTVKVTVDDRITPAGAGKTKACSLSTNTAWDHPRRCGENDFKLKSNRKEVGSPPQVRGKLEYRVEGETNLRITPAGAGKT